MKGYDYNVLKFLCPFLIPVSCIYNCNVFDITLNYMAGYLILGRNQYYLNPGSHKFKQREI